MSGLPAIVALGINLAGPSVIIGFLIGFGGVGGVLLAPALNVIGGIPIHDAIRICMLVYVVAGIVGTAAFLRNGYIRGSILLTLAAGASPGALAGALALNTINAHYLEILIALVILLSGFHALSRAHPESGGEYPIGSTALFFIGAITGFGSSLTGTGGPLLLIPMLLFAQVDVKQAIGLAQAIQIPIGIVATAANAWTGQVDFVLGSILAVAVGVGVLTGAGFAHRSSSSQMRKWLGLALVLIALVYGLRSAVELLAN